MTAAHAAAPFYIAGGTLPCEALSYVTRQADTDLYTSLLAGEFCYVLNSRQMGKSSLMIRTADRLKAEGVAVAVLDLQAIGVNLTAAQWYDGLLLSLGQQLHLEDDLEDFWEDHPQLGPMQRFFEAIRAVVLPQTSGGVVLFVDEIDVIRTLPFSADEFFMGIRQCYIGRATDSALSRLTFCLLGTATPADLIQDTRTSPFNIGKRIEVRDFTDEAAAPLAEGLNHDTLGGHGEESDLNYGEHGAKLLKRILYWTGGHPYLTQRLCRMVAEQGAWTKGDIDKFCTDLFLTHKAKETDDNLMFVRNRLLKSEVDLAGLLDLYKQVREGKPVPDDETNPLTSVLKLSGVARVENGRLKVRNRIYAHVFDQEWIVAHTSDAEKRRQRAAYRRGLVRALAASGGILVVVGALAGFAFLQARLARRETAYANQLLYDVNMTLLQREWQDGNEARAAELLEEMRYYPGRSFEWGYWKRRLHLARLSLPDVIGPVFLSPDGRSIVALGSIKKSLVTTGHSPSGEVVKVLDAVTGQERFALTGTPAIVEKVAFTPDGQRCAISGIGQSGMGIWDMATGQKQVDMTQRLYVPRSLFVFSADGRRLMADDHGTKVTVWDSQTGKEILAVNISFDVHCSADGRRLLTNDMSKPALWDTETGRKLFSFSGNGNATALSPDGTRILVAGNDGSKNALLRLLDGETGRELYTMHATTLGPWLRPLVFSPDSKLLITQRADKAIQIRDAQTGKELRNLPADTKSFTPVVFSPNSRYLVGESGSDLRVWDVATGRTSMSLQSVQPLPDMLYLSDPRPFVAGLFFVFSPDGERLLTLDQNNFIQVWEIATGRKLATLRGNTYGLTSLAAYPDGAHILSSSGDEVLKIWDITQESSVLSLKGNGSTVTSIAVSANRRWIAAAGDSPPLTLWEADTGRLHGTLPKSVAPVALSADGALLLTGREAVLPASAGSQHTVTLWDTATGKERLTLTGVKLPVALSPDGSRIVTASPQNKLIIWDAVTGRQIQKIEAHSSQYTDTTTGNVHKEILPIEAIAFSPDGRKFASCTRGSEVKIWDAATWQERQTIKTPTSCLAFSPDGSQLATTTQWAKNDYLQPRLKENAVLLWDANTGEQLLTILGHTAVITSLAFSTDGKRIATGSLDHTTRLWDTQTGRETLLLKEIDSPVKAVAFSPEGRFLIAGYRNGAVRAWFSGEP